MISYIHYRNNKKKLQVQIPASISTRLFLKQQKETTRPSRKYASSGFNSSIPSKQQKETTSDDEEIEFDDESGQLYIYRNNKKKLQD